MDREQEEAEKILIVMPKKSEKCPHGCKMGIDQPYRNKNPKYENNWILPNVLDWTESDWTKLNWTELNYFFFLRIKKQKKN